MALFKGTKTRTSSPTLIGFGFTLNHFGKINYRISAEVFEGKISLEIDANHLLVSEIENSILTEKSPAIFTKLFFRNGITYSFKISADQPFCPTGVKWTRVQFLIT